MSLTVPAARVPLIRPLTEALEPYDSPGTPGTTYSFQDQVSTKPNMQTESHHHLAPPILDTGLLISTDDEMVDSDNDQHRDEDYDIEIDAIEVYVEPDHDVGMVIDDDANAYGNHVDIEDDLMLDDDIIDVDVVQHEEQAVPEYHISEEEVTATIVQSEVEPVAAPYVNSPQHSNHDVPRTPAQEPEAHLFNEDQQVTKSPSTKKLEEINPNEQAEQAEPEEAKPDDSANSDHSSATLSEGQPGNEEASFVQGVAQPLEENSYSYEETHPESVHSPENEVYQYPIIITYEDSRVSLFPPPAAWTEDSSLDIPSEFFLQDTDVCDKGFDDLFVQLRSILGDSVGPEKELFLKIELLGLNIGEDNTACKTVCLRHVLDWHNQLQQRNDSTIDPPPVCMELYTSSPRFSARLEQLAAAATDGKGLQDYLQLIGFENVDSVQGEAEEFNEELEAHVVDEQNNEHPQIESAPQPERSHSPSPFDEEDELLEVQEQRLSESVHENPTSNTNDESTTGSKPSPSATDNDAATTKVPQVISETESKHENEEEDEEELLGYDGEDEVAENVLENSTYENHGVNTEKHAIDDNEQVVESTTKENEGALFHADDAGHDEAYSDNDKPASIPVFGGDDGDVEGEYNNQQQEFEQYDESRDEYADEEAQEAEEDFQEITGDDYLNVPENVEDGQHYQTSYPEIDNGEQDYEAFGFGGELEKLDGADAAFFADEDDEAYPEIDEVQEIVQESIVGTEVVIEPHTANTVEISPISKPELPQEDEDELIDYDEDEASVSTGVSQVQPTKSDVSSTPQKRVREEEDEGESDGGIDVNQAPKRARAE